MKNVRIHCTHNFKQIHKKFSEEQGLPFKNILNEKEILKVLEEEDVRYYQRVLTPVITIWAFLSQVMEVGSSCRKVVRRVLCFFVSMGKPIENLSDSAYCQARSNIKESVFQKLFYHVSDRIQKGCSEQCLWWGRPVKVLDASTFNMPDTEKNQKAYPQSSSQRPGCGFPIARIAVLFCLATGIVLEKWLGPLQESERHLFHKIYKTLEPGCILLGDRGLCSYADIAILVGMGVDPVFRIHATKKVDYRRGKIVGVCDHIVTWKKPRYQLKTLTKEEQKRLPETMEVRELRYIVEQKGMRSTEIKLVTTLLDHKLYTKEEMARLYKLRWDAEINLRSLKTHMQMEMVRGKSPDIVRKEIWCYLIAYNLVRSVMWEASKKHNVPISKLSFKGTLDTINSYLPKMANATSENRKSLQDSLLVCIAKDTLPERGYIRVEPRCVKKRPKAYPPLTRPRRELSKKYELQTVAKT